MGGGQAVQRRRCGPVQTTGQNFLQADRSDRAAGDAGKVRCQPVFEAVGSGRRPKVRPVFDGRAPPAAKRGPLPAIDGSTSGPCEGSRSPRDGCRREARCAQFTGSACFNGSLSKGQRCLVARFLCGHRPALRVPDHRFGSLHPGAVLFQKRCLAVAAARKDARLLPVAVQPGRHQVVLGRQRLGRCEICAAAVGQQESAAPWVRRRAMRSG